MLLGTQSRRLFVGEESYVASLLLEYAKLLLGGTTMLIYGDGYARIYSGAGEFFQQLGLLFLTSTQEGGEIALRQHHSTGKLIERKPY